MIKQLAENNGVKFIFETEVIAIDAKKNTIVVKREKQKQKIKSDYIINAAGLFADEIAKMINEETDYNIEPARGEFYFFTPSRQDITVRGKHIYASPFFYNNETKETVTDTIENLKKLLQQGKITKTLGVHISPVFLENKNAYTIGPVKTFITDKNDYIKNRKVPNHFLEKTRHIFPNLKESDLNLYYTGIMAVNKRSTDFIIEKDRKFPQAINLIGMDSPAWTAAFAIGRYVSKLLD
jgi:glycerol-3-phosphate dehydrogenase